MLAASAAAQAPAATHTVNQVGNTFVPSSLTIAEGDVVEWVWNGGNHTVTEGTPCTPSGGFDEPLNSGNPLVSITFNAPGTVDYFCDPHCDAGMVGVLTVEPCPAADGDVNEDGMTDGRDIRAFVDGVLGGAPAISERCHGDFNGNEALDEGDVAGFVSALLM